MSFNAKIAYNVRQMFAGVSQILSPVSGSGRIGRKRAEVAMCNAVKNVRGSFSS